MANVILSLVLALTGNTSSEAVLNCDNTLTIYMVNNRRVGDIWVNTLGIQVVLGPKERITLTTPAPVVRGLGDVWRGDVLHLRRRTEGQTLHTSRTSVTPVTILRCPAHPTPVINAYRLLRRKALGW